MQIQDRYVGSARFDSLWSCNGLGQGVHCRVNLFIDFYKGEVGVDTIVHCQRDYRRTVAGLALDFAKSADLHELTAQGCDNGIFEFARRDIVTRDLHGNVRDIYVRQQRDGKRCVCHTSEYHHSKKRHDDSYAMIQEITDHVISQLS